MLRHRVSSHTSDNSLIRAVEFELLELAIDKPLGDSQRGLEFNPTSAGQELNFLDAIGLEPIDDLIDVLLGGGYHLGQLVQGKVFAIHGQVGGVRDLQGIFLQLLHVTFLEGNVMMHFAMDEGCPSFIWLKLDGLPTAAVILHMARASVAP